MRIEEIKMELLFFGFGFGFCAVSMPFGTQLSFAPKPQKQKKNQNQNKTFEIQLFVGWQKQFFFFSFSPVFWQLFIARKQKRNSLFFHDDTCFESLKL